MKNAELWLRSESKIKDAAKCYAAMGTIKPGAERTKREVAFINGARYVIENLKIIQAQFKL